MLTIMTSSETERLTKSIKDEIIEDHENKKDRDGDDDRLDEDNMEVQNPFVHKVEWNDPYDKIRVSFFFAIDILFLSRLVDHVMTNNFSIDIVHDEDERLNGFSIRNDVCVV